MKWGKISSLVLVFAILILVPFTKSFAEDDEPDEIIEQEDMDEEDNEQERQNIPDPPKEDSIIGDEEDVHEFEIETPSSVTGEKSEGSGTVVDFSTTGARAFYTIEDDDQNTFYLMIDMDKPDNNVYFLSDVQGEEINKQSDSSTEKSDFLGNNEEEQKAEQQEQKEKAEQEEKAKQEEGSSNYTFALIVSLVGIAGAFAYYFLVIKRKRNQNDLLEEEQEHEDEMSDSYEDDYAEDYAHDYEEYEEPSEEDLEDEEEPNEEHEEEPNEEERDNQWL